LLAFCFDARAVLSLTSWKMIFSSLQPPPAHHSQIVW
jgi:hypothetical protein